MYKEIDGVALDFESALNGVVAPVAVKVEDGNLVSVVAVEPEVFDVQLVINCRSLPFVVNIRLAELPVGFFKQGKVVGAILAVVYFACRQHEAADGNEDY